MSERVVISALPNGVVRGDDGAWRARISLVLTLQCQTDTSATLAGFPAFLDWPAAVGDLDWQLAIADSNSEPRTVPLTIESRGDSAAWLALFPATTLVEPTETLQANRLGSSDDTTLDYYDSIALHDGISAVYRGALANDLGRKTGVALEPFRAAQIDAAPRNAAPGSVALTRELKRFIRFFEQGRQTTPLTATATDTTFQATLGALMDHPALLRHLSLVIDATLAIDALPADAPATLTPIVEGSPTWSFTVCESRSLYVPGGSASYAWFGMHGDDDPTYGMLPLSPESHRLSQSRLETTTFNLLQRTAPNAVLKELPAPAQGGMRLLSASVPQRLATAIDQQTALQTAAVNTSGLLSESAPPQLDAPAVHRGYRVDVRRAGDNPWYSLCSRRSTYRRDGWQWPPAGQTVEDEGALEPMVFSDQHAADRFLLRTNMDLFEWTGFSLCVARPDDNGERDDDAPIQIDARVPDGSLLPQRFGESYQFRVRAVDIAGNSLSRDEANEVLAHYPTATAVSLAIACLRSSTVQPPLWFRGQPRGPGEAGDAIVLRQAEQRQHATPRFRTHVLPPEVPIDIAEKHGVFDALDDETAWQLIEQHRGTLGCDAEGELLEYLPWGDVFAPYFPDPLVTSGLLVLPDGQRIPLARFDRLGIRRDRLARACGVVFRRGKNEFRVSRSERTVIVDVPQGRRHVMQLVSALEPDALAQLEIAQGELDNARLVEVAARGLVPSLAPAAELVVIHATQRPLTSPVWSAPTLLPRQADDTQATLVDPTVMFDRGSTGRLDVYARWEEPLDDPNQPSWQWLEQSMHVGEAMIREQGEAPFVSTTDARRPPLQHDFADTKHHIVDYTVEATSRFVEFYSSDLTQDPENHLRSSSAITLHVPATAPPAPVNVAHVVPTTRRDADSHMQAVEGYGLRVYLERGWFSSGADEQLAVLLPSADALSPSRSVSRWGANPLHDSAPLPGPLTAQDFSSGELLERCGPSGQQLVTHAVQFSAEHQLPFVDIVLRSQPAFLPLIRLAVARYQPHAIADCHFSVPSLCDFVPLTPDRTLTLQPDGPARWTLTLTGAGYRAGEHDLPTRVEVHIEVQSTTHASNAGAWRRASDTVPLLSDDLNNWRQRWRGSVTLSEDDWPRRRWRRRIVVCEYEPFAQTGDHPVSAASRLISAFNIPL
ncbi:MAG: hypothetical protein AAGJ86_11745 [Pseudomonadota bacterium]